MTCNGEYGAALVLELLIDLFRVLFFRGVEDICNLYRMRGTPTQTVINNHNEYNDESLTEEVQRFFGWAIKEGIGHWRDKVNKVELISSENAGSKNDAYECLTIVQSMRCFHNDVIFDDQYIRDCYPIAIAAQNRGRLCRKTIFCIGHQFVT